SNLPCDCDHPSPVAHTPARRPLPQGARRSQGRVRGGTWPHGLFTGRCVTWQRNRPRRGVVGLEALRFLIVSLVVFTLWQPETSRTWRRDEQPTVVVLCDASGSMATRDVLTRQSNVIERAAWVQEQRDAAPWGALSNRYHLVVEDFSGGRST